MVLIVSRQTDSYWQQILNTGSTVHFYYSYGDNTISTEGAMIICPHCCEPTRDGAFFCRYCARPFNAPTQSKKSDDHSEMRESQPKQKHFLYSFWCEVFRVLKYISAFSLIRRTRYAQKWGYAFVDCWVAVHFLLPGILLLVSRDINVLGIRTLMVYGGLRIFELIVYQTDILLFEEYRTRRSGKIYSLASYRRLIVLLLHNYVELITWFAFFYSSTSVAFHSPNGIVTRLDALELSFYTFTTFGRTDLTPSTRTHGC